MFRVSLSLQSDFSNCIILACVAGGFSVCFCGSQSKTDSLAKAEPRSKQKTMGEGARGERPLFEGSISCTHESANTHNVINTGDKSVWYIRLRKMELIQECSPWCSHDQLRQDENQIRRLVCGAYRDNGSSNRGKEESVGCNQDLREGKNYRLYRLRVVMCNDAPDAVQMNTGLTSVLVFSLVLRLVSSRPYMYDGIKQALGPSQNKTAPLKLLQAG